MTTIANSDFHLLVKMIEETTFIEDVTLSITPVGGWPKYEDTKYEIIFDRKKNTDEGVFHFFSDHIHHSLIKIGGPRPAETYENTRSCMYLLQHEYEYALKHFNFDKISRSKNQSTNDVAKELKLHGKYW